MDALLRVRPVQVDRHRRERRGAENLREILQQINNGDCAELNFKTFEPTSNHAQRSTKFARALKKTTALKSGKLQNNGNTHPDIWHKVCFTHVRRCTPPVARVKAAELQNTILLLT